MDLVEEGVNVHGVPGQRGQPRLERDRDGVDVRPEEAADGVPDGGHDVVELLQAELQVVEVVLEPLLLKDQLQMQKENP